MQNDTITRTYVITYQLGARGSQHVKFDAALRALDKARRCARRNGDLQGVGIEVALYKDGRYYGVGDLTEDESYALARL